MLKVLGSGLVLAIGAGALYLWMHEHDNLQYDLRGIRRHMRKTGDELHDSLEAA